MSATNNNPEIRVTGTVTIGFDFMTTCDMTPERFIAFVKGIVTEQCGEDFQAGFCRALTDTFKISVNEPEKKRVKLVRSTDNKKEVIDNVEINRTR